MLADLPTARIRGEVMLPMRVSDGSTVNARVYTFEGLVDGGEHLALGLGAWAQPPVGGLPLVRLHSECLTGDVLGSQRCDCGPQLDEGIGRISLAGGYLLYLRQEGRGIGLYAKLDAYVLQDLGLNTYDANLALGYPEDARDYTVAAQMLAALGVSELVLLGNNADKVDQLRRLGITVRHRVPTGVHLNPANARYLAAKAATGRHALDLASPAGGPDLLEPGTRLGLEEYGTAADVQP